MQFQKIRNSALFLDEEECLGLEGKEPYEEGGHRDHEAFPREAKEGERDPFFPDLLEEHEPSKDPEGGVR